MKRPPFRGPAALFALIVSLIALWSVYLAHLRSGSDAAPFDRLEAALTDLRFVLGGPRPSPKGVAIVAIDDQTLRKVRAFPLPRSIVATVIRKLAALGAKLIAVDILFVDKGAAADSDAENQALARALAETPSVIAAALRFGAPGGAAAGPSQESLSLEPLVEPIASSAPIGLVNVVRDRMGTPRHVPLLVEASGAVVASLPLRAALSASGLEASFEPDAARLGDRHVPLDAGGDLALRFYGPRGAVTTYSAATVLDDSLPAISVRGRIVFVGLTATGASDLFPTPFDPGLPGVELLATATGNLLEGDSLARTSAVRKLDMATILLLPLLALIPLASGRVATGLALAAALAAAWAAAVFVAFQHGVWLNMALPIAALLPAAVLTMAARLLRDRRVEAALRQSEAAWRRFHSPLLADVLTARPDFLATPVTMEAAIVFIDLIGFTKAAEALGPLRTRDLLQAFHDLIEREATGRNGVVLGQMGDGAIIAFGLIAPAPGDARNAAETAIALARGVKRWLAGLADAGGPQGVKIGAHRGAIVATRLGAASHQHITVAGDTVNVASRLMDVAAAAGAPVALSADLLQAATAAGFRPQEGVVSAPEEAEIRGRTGKVTISFWRPGQDDRR